MKGQFRINGIKILLIVYFLLYIVFFIRTIQYNLSEASFLKENTFELFSILFNFILFSVAFVYIWINPKIAGILLCIWHYTSWAFSLLLWKDTGMVLIVIFPILLLGVFLIQQGMTENNIELQVPANQWKLVLAILAVNYLAIYLLIMFANIIPNQLEWNLPTRVDELSVWNKGFVLGRFLVFAFFIFCLGFILSWKSELLSGYIFILWYFSILYLSYHYPEFANSGPNNLLGLPIFIQGILYIIFHSKFSETTLKKKR